MIELYVRLVALFLILMAPCFQTPTTKLFGVVMPQSRERVFASSGEYRRKGEGASVYIPCPLFDRRLARKPYQVTR